MASELKGGATVAGYPIWHKGNLLAFTGSNGTLAGTVGLVPAPAIADNTKYLRGDGTWQTLTATTVGLGNVTNESKATMFTNAALTGVPTAPTAAADTSTTQIATTAYVVGQGYAKQSGNLTASRALISDSSGKVTTSSVTSTELSYLSGVSSNVQTQFNNTALKTYGRTNVRAMGAVGNGTADDTAAIQAALDIGGIIEIPDGTYKITSQLYLKSNTYIIMSPGTTIIRGADMYSMFVNGRSTDSFTLYNGPGNIYFEGNGATLDVNCSVVNTIGDAICLGHSHDVIIRGLTMKNVRDAHFIEINSSLNVLIEDCTFKDFVDSHPGDVNLTRAFSEAIQIDLAKDAGAFPPFGAYDNTVCQNITVRRCYFKNTGGGVGTHVAGASIWHDTVNISDCYFENLLDIGIHAFNFRKLNVSNCKFLDVDTGVKLEGSYEVTMDNLQIKVPRWNGIVVQNSNTVLMNNVQSNGSVNGNGITIYGGSYGIVVESSNFGSNAAHGANIQYSTGTTVDVKDVDITLSNSIFRNNTNHGIYLHSASNVTISNNTIRDNKRNGILISDSSTSCMVDGNRVYNNNAVGDGSNNINIISGANNNKITNNIIRKGSGTNQAPYGIYIANGCEYNIVSDNDARTGGATTPIYILEGSTIETNNQPVRSNTVDISRTEFIANKGFNSGMAPENTVPAWMMAYSYGFDSLECDVQISSDGVPVVITDTTVDRTTDGTGNVKDKTLAQLQALDAAKGNTFFSGTRIPTFQEFLEVAKGKARFIYPEIKAYRTSADISLIVQKIKDADMENNCVIQSVNTSDLAAVRSYSSVITLGYLVTTRTDFLNALPFAKGSGNSLMLAECGMILANTDLLPMARDYGIDVACWIVDNEKDMQALKKLGVVRYISNKLRRV